MTKFKPGDKVRRKSEFVNRGYPADKVWEVRCSDEDYLRFVGEISGGFPENFELVTPQDAVHNDIDSYIEELTQLRDKAASLGFTLVRNND